MGLNEAGTRDCHRLHNRIPIISDPFKRCVGAVFRLLGVFHDVLYGDVAPVRPGSTLGVVSVRLSRSLFVPGRQLKRGGSPPFPPLLAPTPGWPPRGGLVSAPQLPTPGWPLRERRETPPRHIRACDFSFSRIL